MDLQKFYQATNPIETIKVSNPEEKPYYINFAPVRGGPLIEQIYNKINTFSPDDPTCTLFTGNIGSGKSTELFCLQDKLQQAGFHVVYFTCDTELDMADVDVSDILLAIARNIAQSIAKITIPLPQKFMSILKGAGELLKTEIDITKVKVGVDKQALTVENTGQVTLALGLGEITAKIKADSGLRHRLNEYLGNKKTQLIEAINEELLSPTIEQLKAQGKKGLVIIVDNLDRLDNRPKPFGRPQQEYIFIDQAEYLNKLQCHLIYTMPINLRFVQDYNILTERFNDPKVLPMVAIKNKDGQVCQEGMALLRQMVLARAFPALSEQERLEKITEVFDEPATFDRLCEISGGHVRGILKILNRWIEEEMTLPLTCQGLEKIIVSQQDEKKLAINSQEEWELLKKVYREKDLKESLKYQSLIKNLFIFQYCDANKKTWFDLNPVLIGLPELE
jgi:hypothetical protein